MVQIKQKRGAGVKKPSPRRFWCGYMDYELITRVSQAIAAKAEADAKQKLPSSGLRCDVQEMFPNESYVLFTKVSFLT